MRRFFVAIALCLSLPMAAFATTPAQIGGQLLQSAPDATIKHPIVGDHVLVARTAPNEATSLCIGEGCLHRDLVAAKAGFCDLENPNFDACVASYRQAVVRADPDKPAANAVYTLTLNQADRTDSVTVFTATDHVKAYALADQTVHLTAQLDSLHYQVGDTQGDLADFKVGQTRTIVLPNGTLTLRYREFYDPNTAQASL